MSKCDFNTVAISSNKVEITLRHGCFFVNFLYIFRIPFYKKTYGGLLLSIINFRKKMKRFLNG